MGDYLKMKPQTWVKFWCTLSLTCLLFCVPKLVFAWSGEVTGHVNEQYIVGAGSISRQDGLSILASSRIGDNRRAVMQIKIASSLLELDGGAVPNQVSFSESLALEQSSRLSYQIYNQQGQLLFNAVAQSGSMEFSQFDGVAVHMRFSVYLEDQAQSIDLSSQNLSLNNANPEAVESMLNHGEAVPTSPTAINVSNTNDPFADAYYEDEGCDFWGIAEADYESAGSDDPFYFDETESNYDRYYSDDYASDDEGIHCDSSDSVDDDYESDDGCTDDEWAAEARLASSNPQQAHNRRALAKWKLINRLLPLLVSILMVSIWRRMLARYRKM